MLTFFFTGFTLRPGADVMKANFNAAKPCYAEIKHYDHFSKSEWFTYFSYVTVKLEFINFADLMNIDKIDFI